MTHRSIRYRNVWIVLAGLVFYSPTPALAQTASPPPATAVQAMIRVDQVGYSAAEPKRAVLICGGKVDGEIFHVLDAAGHAVLTAPVTGPVGKWNKTFPYAYILDFGKVSEQGNYTISVAGPASATSLAFRIGPAEVLYSPLAANVPAFYAVQHDVHRFDTTARVYETPTFDGDHLVGGLKRVGGPIDVSGGWYDAGDYLEFVQTASYTDAAMLQTVRDDPASPIAAEARRGLIWLLKMWDPDTRTLYYQIGVGDGNDKVAGDHDSWRLPAADDNLDAEPGDDQDFLKHRAVFRAGPPGTPVSPNLAGRLAAAFGLGFQVYHGSDPDLAARCLRAGRAVFAAAKTENIVTLLTTAPHGYYDESEWRDDMEWGAAEMYLATGEKPFLSSAAHWAKAYLSSAGGGDTLNLYDVGALAHYELAKAITKTDPSAGLEVSRADMIEALRKQLERAAARCAKDPFGLGLDYKTGDLTPHVIGLCVTAGFYDELTGTTQFQDLARAQRHWVLGNNAWGVSFIVGAGSNFPHCLHHQIANLTGNILRGAVLDGPNSSREVSDALREIPEGARPCPADKIDPYKIFSIPGVRYSDNMTCYPCVEPALDYAALSAMMFSRAIHRGE